MTDYKPLTKTTLRNYEYSAIENDVRSAVALAKANLSTALLSDAFKTVPTIKLVEALDSIDSAFPVFSENDSEIREQPVRDFKDEEGQ